MPGPSSPFSLQERIFIVNKFAELKSISDVKRVFRLRFYPKNPRAVPTYMAFQRVVNKFGSCGDVGDPKPERLHRHFVPVEDVRAVEDFFKKNEKDEVWPLLCHQVSRKKLYFMQDGATCHQLR